MRRVLRVIEQLMTCNRMFGILVMVLTNVSGNVKGSTELRKRVCSGLLVFAGPCMGSLVRVGMPYMMRLCLCLWFVAWCVTLRCRVPGNIISLVCCSVRCCRGCIVCCDYCLLSGLGGGELRLRQVSWVL